MAGAVAIAGAGAFAVVPVPVPLPLGDGMSSSSIRSSTAYSLVVTLEVVVHLLFPSDSDRLVVFVVLFH